jgi:hypothetical protein
VVICQGGNRQSVGKGPTTRTDSDARATAGGGSAHTRQARVEELTIPTGGSTMSIVSGGHVGQMGRHQPQGHEFEH